jgi:tetratricopeptide (TPR) repeat protein
LEEHARAAIAEADRLGRSLLRARMELANAAAAQGRVEEARQLHALHREELVEQGQSFGIISSAQHRTTCELLAGDFVRAEAEAREGWDGLGRLGERGYRSTIGALLAEALVELGRLDEAAEIVEKAAKLTSDDDWLTVAHCNWARALGASVTGDHDRAIELAQLAVEEADKHEYYFTRSHYWVGLGRVLVAAGRADEAREAIAGARELCAIKGTTAYDEQLSRLEDQLAAAV